MILPFRSLDPTGQINTDCRWSGQGFLNFLTSSHRFHSLRPKIYANSASRNFNTWSTEHKTFPFMRCFFKICQRANFSSWETKSHEEFRSCNLYKWTSSSCNCNHHDIQTSAQCIGSEVAETSLERDSQHRGSAGLCQGLRLDAQIRCFETTKCRKFF